MGEGQRSKRGQGNIFEYKMEAKKLDINHENGRQWKFLILPFSLVVDKALEDFPNMKRFFFLCKNGICPIIEKIWNRVRVDVFHQLFEYRRWINSICLYDKSLIQNRIGMQILIYSKKIFDLYRFCEYILKNRAWKMNVWFFLYNCVLLRNMMNYWCYSGFEDSFIRFFNVLVIYL